MENLSSGILGNYQLFLSSLPEIAQLAVKSLFSALLIVLYGVFIWKFYRFIAKKNIIELNLSQYNRYEHPFVEKTVAFFLYLVEYIIILPFMIFVWFSIFTLFLILLTESGDVAQLLLLSAAIIAAVRITAYYSEDLSKDLAKLLPFTLLAAALLNYGFFNLDKVLTQLTLIPSFIQHIAAYFILIIVLEGVLRIADLFLYFLGVIKE